MNEKRIYYYRPLARDPRIFKCAGFGAEDSPHREFYLAYFDSEKGLADANGVFVKGTIMKDGYWGDRIDAEGFPA